MQAIFDFGSVQLIANSTKLGSITVGGLNQPERLGACCQSGIRPIALASINYLIFVQASKGVIDLSKANQPSAGALSSNLKGSRFPQRTFFTLATTGIQLFVLSEMRQKGAK